jgi:ribosomal protein L31
MAKSTDITLYSDATVKCSNCASVYTLDSTIEMLSVEICGNCHPFYTGKETLVDTAGRIDKFQARSKFAVDASEKTVKAAKVRKNVQSLGDIMQESEPAPKAEKKIKPAPVVTTSNSVDESKQSVVSTPSTSDDLTIIEGIGPKIAELLVTAGITTFAQLADTDVTDIQKILDEAGGTFATHNPGTWPQQSTLARDGKTEELKQLQDELNGGK